MKKFVGVRSAESPCSDGDIYRKVRATVRRNKATILLKFCVARGLELVSVLLVLRVFSVSSEVPVLLGAGVAAVTCFYLVLSLISTRVNEFIRVYQEG